MARRKTEADDLALALGSLSEENEPDARPRSKAARLAVASYIAPALRKGAEAAARRRVTLEAADGSVAGYTNLLEVQKALIIEHGVEVETQEGTRTAEIPCEWCGLGFPARGKKDGRGGSVKKVCGKCLGVSQKTCESEGCTKVPTKRAFTAWQVNQRGRKPWVCLGCMTRKAQAKRRARERKEKNMNEPTEVEIAMKMQEILNREYPDDDTDEALHPAPETQHETT